MTRASCLLLPCGLALVLGACSGPAPVTPYAHARASEASALGVSDLHAMSEGFSLPRVETTWLLNPVPVDGTTTLELRVTNLGSAEDEPLSVQLVLPDTLAFVTSEGPAPATLPIVDGQVLFPPLSELPPGEEAVWLITLRALAPAWPAMVEARLASPSWTGLLDFASYVFVFDGD